MVLDSLKNAALYYTLHPAFEQVFELLQSTDFQTMQPAKIEVDGASIFYMVSDSRMDAPVNVPLEAHRRYIDIQVPISKSETFGWKETSTCQTVSEPYSEEKDIEFFSDIPDTYLTVFPGEFIILFPDDAHMPCIGMGMIRKVVVKVELKN